MYKKKPGDCFYFIFHFGRIFFITEFRTKNFKFRTRKKERLFHSEAHVSAATVPEQRLQAWSLDVETRHLEQQ
jgi:hypothetical protein